jgi:undecaprenyl-diphosphatase
MLESIILAIVQGLTEFIPVSSSGHLVLAQSLFGIFPGDVLVYDVVLHLATALAAILFYRREIAGILRGLFPPYGPASAETAASRHTLLLVVTASIPTAVMGLLFKDFVESLFESTQAVAGGLVLTGAILIAASRVAPGRETLDRAPWWKAAVIGLVQGFALAPGVSRSGSTISAALFAGLRREDAVRFSFLIFLPAVLGASFLKLRELTAVQVGDLARYAPGFVTAALVGYASITFVLRWTRKGKLWHFGLYCWLVAALATAAVSLR